MGGKKYSNEEIHRLINEEIQRSKGLTAAKHWSHIRQEDAHSKWRHSLYVVASNRGLFGCKTWGEYLEKYHHVFPLGQMTWSDERFHRAVALAASKFPVHNAKWCRISLVVAGKSLKQLYEQAWRSNKSSHQKEKPKWFGHATFKDYVQWAVQNYSDKK